MIPQSFDPQRLGRYSVIRVYYEYVGQPGGEKLFIILKHKKSNQQTYCWCIKTTSQVKRFQADPDLLNGCVFYKAGELAFFDQDTIIDPANFMPLLHDTLQREATKGRYCVEGKMPDDFHQKIVAAMRSSTTLEPKKKLALLEAIGEEFEFKA